MDRERIQSFEQMKVWQEAHQLALRIFALVPSLPSEHQDGVGQLLEKAALEVPKGIAEGFRRRGPRNKAHYYNLSQTALESLRYLLILCRDLGAQFDYDELADKVEQTSRMLDGLVRSMSRGGSSSGGSGGPGGSSRGKGRRRGRRRPQGDPDDASGDESYDQGPQDEAPREERRDERRRDGGRRDQQRDEPRGDESGRDESGGEEGQRAEPQKDPPRKDPPRQNQGDPPEHFDHDLLDMND